MMTEKRFNIEELLARLDTARKKAKCDYAKLLFDGKYEAAAEKLNLMDMIELHINRVEEL